MLKALMKRITRQFKEPPDVYGAIYPLYFVCVLFGLAPYRLVKLENGRKRFQYSIWPIIRSISVVLAFAAFVAYSMVYHREPFGKDIKFKLRYFQKIFGTLLTCCSVIFGCIFASKVVEVFKNIDEVDVSFRSLAVWVPYKSIVVHIYIQLTALFIFGTVGTVTMLVTVYLNDYFVVGNIISLAAVGVPYITNLVMELQYIHYLNILKMRYKLLNDYLEALVQEDGSYNGWMDEGVTTISNIKKVTPGAAQSLQGSKGAEGVKKTLQGSRGSDGVAKMPKSIVAISDPVFIVDQVAALHIRLTDTAHLINQAFCAQQLLRITVAFVSIVTALFLIASNFSKSPSSKEEDATQLDLFFTAWAFSNVCEVIAVVWISSETCEEANTCPRILHKIRNNTTNTKLQDTIEIYSLQMYHNRLSFTVCGLFPLDYTLLYTIVAGVTTYLVILIQFNNADFVKIVSNSTVTTEFPNSTI